MKKYGLILCAVLMMPLGGCNPFSTTAIKTISDVAGGSLPVACTIWGVAKGYFTNVLSINSASNLSLGNTAIAGFNAICANPATTAAQIAADLAQLNTLWVTIQAATTVPTISPTPTPTPITK